MEEYGKNKKLCNAQERLSKINDKSEVAIVVAR